MTDIRLQPQYYAPPPPPGAALPPPYEAVQHSKFYLYTGIITTLMSGLGFLAWWNKPEQEEPLICPEKSIIIEKPIHFNKTVEIEKIVFVDKPVTVEKTIYIDKPVIKEKIVEKTVYVDKLIEHDCPLVVPVECPDPYSGL
jgi:hypothetical protein